MPACCRVAAKGPNWIKLERLLNYDLRLHWKPYVYRYSPEVQHSGFESFTVRFAHGFYPEHHTAYGFNGLGIYDSGNCWIRNVKVVNADNAIGAFRSEFVSVRGVTVSVEKPRYTKSTFPANGHHALWGSGAVLTEFSGFRITTQYMHDITFSVFAENLVFANGQMLDGNIDFHRGGPHNNLASNINLGRGTRAFHSGGNTVRGTHAAANNTVWNVGPASKRQVALPGCDFGPHLVFVGSYAPPTPGAEGDSNSGDRRRRSLLASPQLTGWCRQRRWWVEDVPTTQQLLPRDLYAAMVATRRNRIRG
ncbi:hypothetical protein CHLNCDRAFT_137068 [Chlorella variabilis]|uniref:Right handed beta helix domain-containing protein n=1 Tax=Chlorella variabilis TaxID=554065 RepID=E1ZLX4_CHLVA|nr:hypothetical protein CHLNCDRAFT_137068 [Chlorella variabilis]EFN53340.1 hypothetical protein CHLNCDRAFT_137068 [Chlorella variabilis]|eukprot:XP_005845442.1 hypothetical protein CHLNCDRAFT_137068 [Chlorella variabilis]